MPCYIHIGFGVSGTSRRGQSGKWGILSMSAKAGNGILLYLVGLRMLKQGKRTSFGGSTTIGAFQCYEEALP
jgi:hypothetical protein